MFQQPTQPYLFPSNPAFEIARTLKMGGRDAIAFNFPGRRSGSLSTTEQVDVVEFPLTNNRIPVLTGTNAVEVVSSSTNDAAGGTGVRSVKITYLDQNFNIQSTTVALNGILPVTVQKDSANIQPQAIWWMHSASVGSGGVAAGTITLRLASAGAAIEQISANGNMSLSARSVVPRGYTGYIYDLFGSAITGNQDIRLRATVNKDDRTLLSGVFCFQALVSIREGGNGQRVLPYLSVPEFGRIKISDISSAPTGSVEASFTMLFVRNS